MANALQVISTTDVHSDTQQQRFTGIGIIIVVLLVRLLLIIIIVVTGMSTQQQ